MDMRATLEMWKVETSGALGQGWPNSWEESEGEEDSIVRLILVG